MEVVWLLQGEALSRLRRVLQAPATAPRTPAWISREVLVTEIYRELCLEDNVDQRVGGSSHTKARRLIERICVLFDLVDIDNIGMVDWIDFTDLCVYIGGGVTGDHHGQEEEHGANSGCGGGRDQDDNVTRFAEKLGYTDRSSHCHEIRSMCFVTKLDLLIVVEGTATLKIYAAGPHKIGEIEPGIAMQRISIDNNRRYTRHAGLKRGNQGGRAANSKGTADRSHEDSMAVLAAEFVARDNQAVVSCADGYLTVWELSSFKMLYYTRVRHVQVGLRFCPSMGVMASWGVNDFNHEISIWEIDTLTVLHVIDGHSGPVKDVCEVACNGDLGKAWDPILVTAGMDGKVITWDLQLGTKRKKAPKKLIFLIGHFHGVVSVTYSDEHDLIISAGFDFNANCWDRSTSHIHMKLVGHRRSLIGVVIVRHETQRAVTGDEGGSFRVWDIRRGHSDHGTCLQNFSLRNTRASPRTMAVSWREGLVTAGRKMHLFRAARNVKVAASPGGAWFSSYTGEFCVLLREAVFVDALTGHVSRRAFQQTNGREITAFCMDSRHKKAVVGDQKGGLRLCDGVTGRWLMSAMPHRSEVSALLFIDEDNIFVSTGWDRTIQVHDARVRFGHAGLQTKNMKQAPAAAVESAPDGNRCAVVLRSVVDAHDGDITLMAVSTHLRLLATASNDLTVRVWDYRLLRLEEIIVAHRHEITSVCFLDPLPCLATADMAGKVLIWATRPHPNARNLLVVIRNTIMTGDAPKVGEIEGGVRIQRKVLPTPVTCMAFHHKASPKATTPGEGEQVKHVEPDQAHSGQAGDPRPPETPGRKESEALTPSDVGSMLFTGDESGAVKKWDVTGILIDKLGHATCNARFTEDKASVCPTAGGRRSHQFVHHREGPLDGVGAQAVVRFKELTAIAKVLRRGDNLTPDGQPGIDREKKNSRGHLGGRISTGNSVTLVNVNSSSCGQTTSSYSERSRDRLTARPRQGPQSGRDTTGASGTSTRPSPAATPDESNGQRNSRQKRPKEEVQAALNAPVDTLDPVASWAGHGNSVTSMQVILHPPTLLTASLDSSVRLFSLNGSLLGIVVDENEVGKAQWLFRPPPTGREAEASAQAVGLEEQLRSVRRIQREALRSGIPGNKGAPVDPMDEQMCGPDGLPGPASVRSKAPESGSAFGASVVHELEQSGTGRGKPWIASAITESPEYDAARLKHTGVAAEGVSSQAGRAAMCLSRIKDIIPVRGVAIQESEAGSESQENIDAMLNAEAKEGRIFQPPYGSRTITSQPRRTKSHRGGQGVRRSSKVAWEQPLDPHNKSPNLAVEQKKKHAKRTRSALQFLSNSISRTTGHPAVDFNLPLAAQSHQRGQTAGDRLQRPHTSPGVQRNNVADPSLEDPFDGDSATVVELMGSSSASTLCRAVAMMAPVRALQRDTWGSIPVAKQAGSMVRARSAGRRSGTIPLTQRSAATLASACSNVSTSVELAKEAASDRRRRRIDSIVDGVSRLGQHEAAAPMRTGGIDGKSPDEEDVTKPGKTALEVEAVARRGEEGTGAATVVISTRVSQALSRFERFVNDENGNQDGANQGDHQGKAAGRTGHLAHRRRDMRVAARKAAIRHNERYLRAQRFDLVTLQETQQRRQEATVGLTGQAGERFGPYSLDDVLEFQTFACHQILQGTEPLTVRRMMANPGVQADPYSQALLQELARLRVLQWNQALTVEELMQLVFHFAKSEEIKRMISVMDLALLLERLRDAFVSAKDSLLGSDGALTYHFVNDIAITIHTTNADSCGTCTMKELHGIMTRVGSDLFSHGQEDLEALAAQCGVSDGLKELTAEDITVIITKLALLQNSDVGRKKAVVVTQSK